MIVVAAIVVSSYTVFIGFEEARRRKIGLGRAGLDDNYVMRQRHWQRLPPAPTLSHRAAQSGGFRVKTTVHCLLSRTLVLLLASTRLHDIPKLFRDPLQMFYKNWLAIPLKLHSSTAQPYRNALLQSSALKTSSLDVYVRFTQTCFIGPLDGPPFSSVSTFKAVRLVSSILFDILSCHAARSGHCAIPLSSHYNPLRSSRIFPPL